MNATKSLDNSYKTNEKSVCGSKLTIKKSIFINLWPSSITYDYYIPLVNIIMKTVISSCLEND